MNFDFTEDQQQLRDAVARWVEKAHGFERRHALAKAGGASRAVYAELAELGLSGLAIAPEHGGLGFGAVEAMVVMEELGRGLVSAPLAAAALVTPTLLARAPAALQARWLPRVADGSALVVWAHQERRARYWLSRVSTRAEKAADGSWRLAGAKCHVAAGDEADAFVLAARTSGAEGDAQGIALFLVARDAPGLSLNAYPTQDGARAAEFSLVATPAELLCEDALPAMELAADVAIAAQAAEAVGLMDKLLAVTVEYLNTRKQFGVPIASFQALRHRMADVKMQLELARSMSYFASLKLGEPEAGRRRALSQAKVQLGRSMRLVGQECIQMHGGIGCTDEYIASHYFKRLTMLEMAFGDTLHHLGEVSARMQDNAGVFA
jgi:alkylation response protein AidB-like acyl-CoA dehydrogenase